MKAPRPPPTRVRINSAQLEAARIARYPHYGSLLISGLSYKTAVSNELLTSIFPL
jgi:hypothetical protein